MPKALILKPRLWPALAIALFFGWAGDRSAASNTARFDETCDAAARRAARAEGVPLDVLRAITRVETGRTRNGRRIAWPWTVNMEGKGVWFDTAAEARAYVHGRFAAGARSFDVGCFQINYRWHGHAFRSIDTMFDPDRNATYAARFLSDLHAELGSWPAAAGAYHSRTTKLAAAYTKRFNAVLAKLDDLPPARTADASITIPADTSPLFSTTFNQGPAKLGSLVPAHGSRAAFIAFN